MSQWDDNEQSDPYTGDGGGPKPDPPQNPGTTAPSTDAFYQQVFNWYKQYFGREPSVAEVNSHRGNPGGLPAVLDLIKNSPEAAAYTKTQTPPASTTTTPAPGSNPSTVPPGSIGSLLAPFQGASPDYVDPKYPAAPTFPTLPDWRSPTPDEAAKLPGYQFARDQALQGLDLSAAARGVTNTGGTLQDIIKFGDQFASQNYQTARQNSLDDYQTNLASKYLLPYQAAYQTWGVQNPQAGIDAQNKNSFNWNNYLQGYNIFRNQQNDSFNKLFGVAQLGAGLQ